MPRTPPSSVSRFASRVSPWAGAVGLLAAAGPAAAAAPTATPCPSCSVVWIVIDTTRADRVGCFGGPKNTTPHIDALCQRGLSFAEAYSQAPATMLSVASYMSGRYRRSTGIDFMLWEDQDFHPLSPEITTVAEALKGAGFQTIALTANPSISKASHAQGAAFDLDYDQGFDVWRYATDDEIAAQGPKQLEQLAAGKGRFLLYLHAMGPHFPNMRRPGFEQRRGDRFPTTLKQADAAFNYTDINKGTLDASGLQGEYLRALYDDDLWYADQSIVGPVLQKIKTLGLEDKVLVIVTSDHGEALGEPHEKGAGSKEGHIPYWGHSHPSLVAETLHVPLVFAGPGIPRGQQVKDHLAENVDLGPTMLAYLGIPQKAEWGWDGAPLFGPGAVGSTWAISDQGANKTARSAVRGLTHTLEWYQSWDRYYFFDHRPTPRAEAPASPELDRLKGILQKYVQTAHPPGKVQNMAAPQGELLDQLKALGYMEQ